MATETLVNRNQQSRKASTSSKKKSRRYAAAYRKAALTRATEAILDTTVVGVEYPGGESRESYRMQLKERSIIATRRSSLKRARTECITISALNKHNASVPMLLGTNYSQILLQEEIQGDRLSRELHYAGEARCYELQSAALDSLACIHRAATLENLEGIVQTLGGDDAWIETLLEQPQLIGKRFDVNPPQLDRRRLIEVLRVTDPQFIKWDSRPGNALLSADGKVYWFDWEHAGKRNRLDDMAWLLGDEFSPDYPDMETRLIEEYCSEFRGPMSEEHAHDYLMIFGCFHMSIRLGLILKHMSGQWWDQDFCITNDKIGVTLLCAQRLCQRGSRWSGRTPLTRDMSRWFNEMEATLQSLEKAE